MKKNNLYVVFGGKCDEDDDYNVTYTEYFGKYVTFKNKDKANKYVDKLIDDFMKMKSYSLNYEITDSYRLEDTPIETYFTDIRDKNDYTVFRIEIMVIDLNNVIM